MDVRRIYNLNFEDFMANKKDQMAKFIWEIKSELEALSVLFKNLHQCDFTESELLGIGIILGNRLNQLEEVEEYINTTN